MFADSKMGILFIDAENFLQGDESFHRVILYESAAVDVLGSFAHLLKRKFYKRKEAGEDVNTPLPEKQGLMRMAIWGMIMIFGSAVRIK